MTPEEMLNKLFEYQCQLDALELERQAARESILTPELKQKLNEIDLEFSGKSAGAQENITEITEQIKSFVIEQGKTIKSQKLMAVYAKGRVSWDTKGVEGFALAHPELLAYRKEGEPSVSIRKV